MTDEARTEEMNKKSDSPSETNTPSVIGQPTRSRPHCKVLLLDGEYYIIPVHKKAKGEVVINELFRHLELKELQEKEYFSVYYVDSTDSKIFLNPFKQIRKQLPNASRTTTWELFFGVQFYATELSMLAGEITRYLYVLQMCRDIKEKRIIPDRSTKLQLVSLLVQANCGDYDAAEHTPGYVDPYIDMIYNPAEIPIGLPNSVIEVHKEKTGFKPSEADTAFFMIAKALYKFGQQIFPVRDHIGQTGQIGASIVGLFFHKDGKEFMHIPWQDVVTVGYRRRKLRIKYHPKGSDDAEQMLYLLCSEPNTKLVWRGCVEQHTFFRLEKPTQLVTNSATSFYPFNRNSELRFSRGKTLYQMLRGERKQQDFQRSLSVRLAERKRDKVEDDDVFLPARNSHRNMTIRDKEPEPIGLPDRTSKRNETMYIKETSGKHEQKEPPTPDNDPEQIKTKEDDTDSREQSLEPDSLQLRIEAALKKRSEENLNKATDKTEQTEFSFLTTVEINHTTEENKNDNTEEEKKEDTTVELDVQQDSATNTHLVVDVETTDPDGANVEFSRTDKCNSSFLVTLEETSPSPPPDMTGGIMLEGKYRNDSIIPTDLDPTKLQLLMETAKQNDPVLATAVNFEVHTSSTQHDEIIAEIIESEMNKVSHIEMSSGNDIEVAVKAESPHSDLVNA